MIKVRSYLAVAVLVILSLVIAGCGTPGTPTQAVPTAAPSQPTSAPVENPTTAPVPATAAPSASQPTKMVMGIAAEPETYFPGYESTALASYGFELVFNMLTTFDLQGKMVGDLAQSWELSEDQLTWTFHLVPGVKWQDGEPFSAEDVAFTFETLADSKYTGTYYSMVAPVAGAVDKHDGKATEVSGIKVIDDNTISFTTAEPNALLLQTMASVMPILPKHLLKDIPVADLANSAFARAPIGTGPFALKEWKAGSSLTYTANKDYFMGAPKIDTFIWQIIPEPSAQITALLNGEIDYLDGISADDFPQLQSAPNLATLTIPGSRFNSLNYHSKDPLLADVRVRQAIAHAIDREGVLAGLAGGLGKVESCLFHPSLPEYDPNLKGYSYDVEAAKALLTDAGWTDQDGDGIVEAKGVQGVADGTKFSIELGTTTVPLYVKENEIIQQSRADRVQPCRGLIEEEDVRVEGHGPGQGGPFLHASADLRRIIVFKTGQTDQGKLQGDQFPDPAGIELRIVLKGQGYILGEGHRTPECSILVQDSEPAHHPHSLRGIDVPEARVPVEHFPSQRLFQPDQDLEKCALPAAASAHDDEDVSLVYRKGEVALKDKSAVRHGEVLNDDVGLGHSLSLSQMPSTSHTTVMIAVATMMLTMLVTTADLVASPTAEALLPHCMPLRHPATAMRIPKTRPEKSPIQRFVRVTAFFVSL